MIIKNIFTNRNLYNFTPVRRWKIDYCNKALDRKIYLANQDNSER